MTHARKTPPQSATSSTACIEIELGQLNKKAKSSALRKPKQFKFDRDDIKDSKSTQDLRWNWSPIFDLDHFNLEKTPIKLLKQNQTIYQQLITLFGKDLASITWDYSFRSEAENENHIDREDSNLGNPGKLVTLLQSLEDNIFRKVSSSNTVTPSSLAFFNLNPDQRQLRHSLF